MFQRGKKEQPQVASAALPAGLEIRVMPKEFLGVQGERSLNQNSVPPPTVAPELPKPVVERLAPQAPLVLKRRSHLVRNVTIFSVIFLLFVALLSAGAYYYFVVLPEEQVVVPIAPPQSITTPVVPEPVLEPTPGVDTDSDGLTDREEALYGTDFRNADSDADSFLDGNEVFHRYDPLGLSPSTLFDTGSVLVYKGARPDGKNFEIYYPKAWAVTEGIAGFTISLPRTESISLAYEVTSVVPAGATKSTTKNGFVAYTSKDKRTVMIELENGAYAVFNYELNDAMTIEYLQTFQMMVNSYQHVEA